MSKINTRAIIITHDLTMAAVAWMLAWGARFNFYYNFPDWHVSVYTIPFVLIIQGLMFWVFGVYRGLWRFASLPDLKNIIKASVTGCISITILLFFMTRLEGIPRTIFILYPFFLIFLLGGSRFGYRLWKDNPLSASSMQIGKKALIIGAGRAGEMLVRDMLRNDNYTPIGFIDDNANLTKSKLHGIPILGSVDMLPELVDKVNADIIVIATPSATNKQMRRIVAFCEQTGLPIRTLPSITQLKPDDGFEGKLHELSIDDLLGREKVELDWSYISEGIAGKVILVTGGGGSIGSELCLQIGRINPKLLLVYEKNEFSLYNIQAQLSESCPGLNQKIILGDIRDEEKVNYIFSTYRPDIVFHTAAYKHVPILEYEIREAVLNNIYGTKVLAEAADRYNCGKFIYISTDKAVNPPNVLGKSKRIAELYCEEINRISETQFVTVRFGNVLGSNGSVVPLFKKQIQNGGPVTVTDPDITRYFMTIEEACQLILQAGAMGVGGEIYVLDMGEPVKISYLAEQMIRLSGFEADKDIKIEYIGLRPGEKLYEELFYDDEKREETIHKKIFLANQNQNTPEDIDQLLKNLKEQCDKFMEEELKITLDAFFKNIQKSNSGENLVKLIHTK